MIRSSSTMTGPLRRVWLVLLPLALSACREDTPLGPCTDEWNAGVIVEVRHAVTGAPAADGARGYVAHGFYQDSLRPAPEGARLPGPQALLYAAWERPGVYDVHVFREGFAPWSQLGVQVAGNHCGASTALLRAELEPNG